MTASFVVAIDGPSGTGKSTVARKVAQALGAGYLDTGAMYRIVTLAVLRAGIEPADAAQVAELLDDLEFSSPVDPLGQTHWWGAEDVSAAIRTAEVTAAVSAVSANPAVRDWLRERQQRLARSGRMVVEGRDIGTVIVPDAELKVYLTASEQVRATRRHGESRAGHGDLTAVREAIARRDSFDSTRQHAPLASAGDAVEIDSSDLTIGQVVEAILTLVERRALR